MGKRHESKATYRGSFLGPDALRVIGQAFDAAWEEIAGNFGKQRHRQFSGGITDAERVDRMIALERSSSNGAAVLTPRHWMRLDEPVPGRRNLA